MLAYLVEILSDIKYVNYVQISLLDAKQVQIYSKNIRVFEYITIKK